MEAKDKTIRDQLEKLKIQKVNWDQLKQKNLEIYNVTNEGK